MDFHAPRILGRTGLKVGRLGVASSYGAPAAAYEEAFERTETEWGPWTIVEATNRRFTTVKIYQTIISALEYRLGWEPMILPSEAEAAEAEDEAKTNDDELEMEELEETTSPIVESKIPLESPHANLDRAEEGLAKSEELIAQASTE